MNQEFSIKCDCGGFPHGDHCIAVEYGLETAEWRCEECGQHANNCPHPQPKLLGEELFKSKKHWFFIYYEQYKMNDQNEITDQIEIEKTTVHPLDIPTTLIKIAYAENDLRFVKWDDTMGSDKIVEYIKTL